MIAEGFDLTQTVKNLIDFAHKILQVKMGQKVEEIVADNDEIAVLEKIADSFSINTLLYP